MRQTERWEEKEWERRGGGEGGGKGVAEDDKLGLLLIEGIEAFKTHKISIGFCNVKEYFIYLFIWGIIDCSEMFCNLIFFYYTWRLFVDTLNN